MADSRSTTVTGEDRCKRGPTDMAVVPRKRGEKREEAKKMIKSLIEGTC